MQTEQCMLEMTREQIKAVQTLLELIVGTGQIPFQVLVLLGDF